MRQSIEQAEVPRPSSSLDHDLPHKEPHRPEIGSTTTPVETANSLQPLRPVRPASPPKLLEKRKPKNTAQRQIAQARAVKWQGGRIYELATGRTSSSTPEHTQRQRSYGITRRPYLGFTKRRTVIAGTAIRVDSRSEQTEVLHIDFTDDEFRFLRQVARHYYNRPSTGGRPPLRDLRHILKKDRTHPSAELNSVIHDAILRDVRDGFAAHLNLRPPPRLLLRTEEDVKGYLRDLIERRHNSYPQCLRLEPARSTQPVNRTSHMLYARELLGIRGFGALRRYQNFDTVFQTEVEDRLEPRMEFTNCAGDIVTISWFSNNDFICGTTTHSDRHNQQYNKPGNLALGNVAKRLLVAHPDHRVLRPIVTEGENALESMRHSQDPWLFASVVSSDFSTILQLAFTSSFDKTTKIWRREHGQMTNVGTWLHDGRVNFVVASEKGLVATAADVSVKNVRVYQLDKDQLDHSGATFDEYSCSRISEAGFVQSDNWSYYPATIRWGIAPHSQHLLLVGYSPRSHDGDDLNIPEDKLETGELCVFDTILKQPVKITGVAAQNVFDVVWHPTQDMFAVATSTSPGKDGRNSELKRSQVRVYWWTPEGFSVMKTLDCPAADINMLTMR